MTNHAERVRTYPEAACATDERCGGPLLAAAGHVSVVPESNNFALAEEIRKGCDRTVATYVRRYFPPRSSGFTSSEEVHFFIRP